MWVLPIINQSRCSCTTWSVFQTFKNTHADKKQLNTIAPELIHPDALPGKKILMRKAIRGNNTAAKVKCMVTAFTDCMNWSKVIV